MNEKAANKTRWTPDQQQVIDARGTDLLVSAAAGSGKTAVLIERILKLITDEKNPIDIDEMLVVTFTKAAASEMRTRLRNALKNEIAAALTNPKADRSYILRLKNQELMVNNAQISTIHSFCSNVIKNHFQEIGLDPGYHMAGDREEELLKKQAMERVFKREYAAGNEAFLHFIDTYAKKNNDAACMEMIDRLYSRSESAPWPDEWLDSLLKPYNCSTVEELYQTVAMTFAFRSVRDSFAAYRFRLAAFYPLFRMQGMKSQESVLTDDLAALDELLACRGFAELETVIGNVSHKTLPGRNLSDEQARVKENYAGIRKDYKEFVKKVKIQYFSRPSELVLEEMEKMQPIASELVRLTRLFGIEFAALKRQKNTIDYSDLEHFALAILEGKETSHALTDTARELQNHYKAVMVDEYQDSNGIQEELIRAVCGSGNRFAVGDIKQSIYRFRMAEPAIFSRMMREYAADKGGGRLRIDLSQNFRSRKQVLDFTNEIFESLMSPELGGIEYDEKAMLYYGADCYQPNADMDVELLLADSEDEDREEAEALIIADKIQRMVGKMTIYDKDLHETRLLQYSDIVILFRSPKTSGPKYSKVLKDCGIPVVMMEQDNYFDIPEVANVLNLLRVIDNPFQDQPLVAVLKNFFDFSNDKLALIRMNGRDGSFAKAFFEYVKANPEDGNAAAFLVFLQKYRKAKTDTPLHVLLTDILRETGYLDRISCLPHGENKRENIRQLVDQAIEFEAGAFSGVFSFLNYIDQIKKYEIEYGQINNTGENDNTVKILSIHKSKGLEFPVVFAGNLGHNFNSNSKKGDMILEQNAGLGLKTLDPKSRLRSENLFYGAVKDYEDSQSLGEEMRVLYVALTRAREKLILTGYCKRDTLSKFPETGKKAAGFRLDYASKKKASNYLDWVLPILAAKAPEMITFVDRESLKMIRQVDDSLNCRSYDDLKPASDAKEILADIQAKRDFVYPFCPSAYKSKYSVSEIKHRAIEKAFEDGESLVTFENRDEQNKEAFEPMIPAFMREDGAKETSAADENIPLGALRGSAFHRFMECLDFAGIAGLRADGYRELDSFYEDEKKKMLAAGRLDAEQEKLLVPYKIKAFMRSDLAYRMAQAAARGQLFREQPFVMGGDPADFFSLVDSAIVRDENGFCLIQGIIDAYFIEDGQIVLMDYKTDSVQNADELAKRYDVQLKLYAMALDRVNRKRGLRVSEIMIYSSCLCETIELEV